MGSRMNVGCGVCGAEVEIDVKSSSCWACGAIVERRPADGTVVTNAADPEARYRVQRTTNAPASGRNHIGYFETFDLAQDACDVNYPQDPSGERQEITDRETNEQWWRADGHEQWSLSRRSRSALS
jgi:hypothetical protein